MPPAAVTALLLASLLLAACGEPAVPLMKVSDLRDPVRRTILVTGFGPFLDVKENPSWEAIRDLDGARIGAARIAVARLDVTYASAADQLQAAIDRVKPDVVLALGVAPDAALRLETTARNLDTAPSPDVAGEVRAGRKVREDGAATLASRLPLEALRADLEAGGFEVRASDDAGGYLCNHLFYELLTRRPTGVAGFVHVPELRAPWDLPRLKRAVRCMLETLARG